MASKNKKNVQLKKADIDFYRMTGVFAIACVFIVLVLKMNSTMVLYHSTGNNMTYNFYMLCKNPVFAVFAGLVAAAGIAWFVLSRIQKKDESMKLIRSSDALVLIGYLAVFWLSFGVRINSQNHMFFIAFTIIASVLYYISRLYKSDFLFYSTLNALFALVLYFTADKAGTGYTVFKAVLIALSVAAIMLFPKKNKSHFKNSKHNKALFYIPSYVSLLMFVVFLFIREFTFITVNAILVIMLVQYIIASIVYTIRLIRE